MFLALRHQNPNDAPFLHDLGALMIEVRLVSRYAHGGIVIGDTLYHSTASKGVHAVKNPDLRGWLLIDLGTDRDEAALKLFYGTATADGVEGADYDFLSLVAFVGPRARDSSRYYCFELCYYLITGEIPCERVTSEVLLGQALHILGHTTSPLPTLKTIPAYPE